MLKQVFSGLGAALASLHLRLQLLLSILWVRARKRFKNRVTREEQARIRQKRVRSESSGPLMIGNVRLDLKIIAHQLKNDLRDDWFPDPLNFGDMLAAEALRSVIDANIAANGGRYIPGRRSLFNIPKSGFTLRYALETGLADRVLYQGLAAELLPLYDKLIPWNSFSHRFDYERERSSERYTFKHGIESWKHFVGSARSALSPSSYLVSTDIANFFEHIQLSRLKERMAELVPLVATSSEEVQQLEAKRELLFEFLVHWSYEEGRGLPQNRDASSFLANLYMRDIDIAMRNAGYESSYFRYMDDIKIVCEDEFQARKALKQLTVCLRELGLTLNSRKTVIVPAADIKTIDECLDGGSDSIQQIDVLWRKRTRGAIFTLWPSLRKRTLELIAEGQVDGKEFRYCIKRISLLARFKELYFPPSLYASVTAAISSAVATHPASTDQYVEYLSSVDVTVAELAPLIDYLVDPEKSIYTWQNYRLWILLAEKKIITESLRLAALNALSGNDTPARAGASIYLGATGCNEGKGVLMRGFGQLSSFIGQRSAIIAFHEEPYHKVREFLINVRPDLHGVYRHLNKSGVWKGKYYVPKERIPLELAAQEEASYG